MCNIYNAGLQLKKYAGHDYRSPRKCPTQKEMEEMNTIYKEATEAQAVFNKFIENIASELFLTEIKNKNFLDGSMRKIRKYFWGQLKNGHYFHYPESISIFLELNEENSPILRIGIDIDELHDTENFLQTHNTILDYELPNNCKFYISEGGHKITIVTDNIKVAKEYQQKENIKKIVVCKTMILSPNNNLNYAEALSWVKQFLPIYDKILHSAK